MRILLVSNLYAPEARGGAEGIVKVIAEGLVKEGHDVTVLTTTARVVEDAGTGRPPSLRSFGRTGDLSTLEESTDITHGCPTTFLRTPTSRCGNDLCGTNRIFYRLARAEMMRRL